MKLVNPVIKLAKIRLQTLLKYNGYYVYISGKTNNQICLYNAVNLSLSKEGTETFRTIEKNIEHIERSDLDKDRIVRLYDELRKKHNDTIYNRRPNPIGKLLDGGREKFLGLNMQDECQVIVEIVNATIIGSISGINLSNIGGARKTGIMLMSKKLDCAKEYKLVNTSSTGLIVEEIDLLKL